MCFPSCCYSFFLFHVCNLFHSTIPSSMRVPENPTVICAYDNRNPKKKKPAIAMDGTFEPPDYINPYLAQEIIKLRSPKPRPYSSPRPPQSTPNSHPQHLNNPRPPTPFPAHIRPESLQPKRKAPARPTPIIVPACKESPPTVTPATKAALEKVDDRLLNIIINDLIHKRIQTADNIGMLARFLFERKERRTRSANSNGDGNKGNDISDTINMNPAILDKYSGSRNGVTKKDQSAEMEQGLKALRLGERWQKSRKGEGQGVDREVLRRRSERANLRVWRWLEGVHEGSREICED